MSPRKMGPHDDEVLLLFYNFSHVFRCHAATDESVPRQTSLIYDFDTSILPVQPNSALLSSNIGMFMRFFLSAVFVEISRESVLKSTLSFASGRGACVRQWSHLAVLCCCGGENFFRRIAFSSASASPCERSLK